MRAPSADGSTAGKLVVEWAATWPYRVSGDPAHLADLMDRVRVAIIAEREACALVADAYKREDTYYSPDDDPATRGRHEASDDIAALIRARAP